MPDQAIPWEQHGRNRYLKLGNYEYMVSKGAYWALYRKHKADTRWENLGAFATEKDAMEAVQ